MKASEKFAETTFFEKSDSAGAAGEIFCLELSGYEGPLHTLLELARRAKVDLAEISMAQLAQQYLDFIAGAEALNMELAAEYLVMASWLVQLKSKYLLPRADDLLAKADEGDDARALRFRLLKLQAMRDAAQKLLSRPRFGLQLFGPGCVTNFEQEKKKGTVDVKNIAMSDLVNAYRPGTRKKLAVVLIVQNRQMCGRLSKREAGLKKNVRGLRNGLQCRICSIWTWLVGRIKFQQKVFTQVLFRLR